MFLGFNCVNLQECVSVTNVSPIKVMCFGSVTPRNEAKLLCQILNTSQNPVNQ